MRLVNSFEGGTSGSAITAAGSGGASGDAFDAIAGASPPQWSNSHPAHGSLGMALQGIGECEWTSTSMGTPTTVFGRTYVLITATPTVVTTLAAGLTPTSATSRQFSVRIATTGKISNLSKGGTVVNSTTTLSLNTLYRLEFKMVTVASGTCTVDCTIYLGDATSATETMAQASGTGVSTDTSINQMWWGSANAVTANTVFLDDVGVDTTGFMGPVIVPQQLRRSFIPMQMATRL